MRSATASWCVPCEVTFPLRSGLILFEGGMVPDRALPEVGPVTFRRGCARWERLPRPGGVSPIGCHEAVLTG